MVTVKSGGGIQENKYILRHKKEKKEKTW